MTLTQLSFGLAVTDSDITRYDLRTIPRGCSLIHLSIAARVLRGLKPNAPTSDIQVCFPLFVSPVDPLRLSGSVGYPSQFALYVAS